MQKAGVILLLILLIVGSLTRPAGYIQSFSLHDMYVQCSKEDPDITPLDFVFEHMLNLEDVMHYFEGEEEEEEGEYPHEPFHLVQSLTQFALAIPKAYISVSFYQEFLSGKIDYPLSKEDFYHHNFFTDIFHPPIV